MSKSLKIAIVGCGSPGLIAAQKFKALGHHVEHVSVIDDETIKNFDVAVDESDLTPAFKITSLPDLEPNKIFVDKKAGIPSKHRKKRKYHN